jgi:hypothetical protein
MPRRSGLSRVEVLCQLALCGASGKPGLAPAGDLLFFVSPKKPKEKKGDPAVCVPALRYGQPAVLVKSGVSLELAFGSNNREP